MKGLPVLARQDTTGYRVGKFVRRSRFGVAATVVLGLSLIAGIFASVWQARRAERRFNEVRTFANVVLFDLHDKISNIAGITEARELLVSTVLQYLDRLVRDSAAIPRSKESSPLPTNALAMCREIPPAPTFNGSPRRWTATTSRWRSRKGWLPPALRTPRRSNP